jgi:hypothetical protein
MNNRWWTYQQERFPIGQHGLLIAVFSTAAVGYSYRLRQVGSPFNSIGAIVIAFVTLFLFFLQLRIADEFKDAAEDAKYRSYRPVPRGLVTLRELGLVAVASAFIQQGLAFVMGLPLVLLLIAVWGYMLLMRQEFFVPQWLKAHPLIYLLSHALIMPLMALYATACDWATAEGTAPAEIGYFLLVSFFTSLMIELGRKIRAPEDEESGVETYSALWGQARAGIAWLITVATLGLTALVAAVPVQSVVPIAGTVAVLLVGSALITWRFVIRPVRAWAKGFEVMSALWTLLIYLNLSILPWAIGAL